jgi:hypothetical protein
LDDVARHPEPKLPAAFIVSYDREASCLSQGNVIVYERPRIPLPLDTAPVHSAQGFQDVGIAGKHVMHFALAFSLRPIIARCNPELRGAPEFSASKPGRRDPGAGFFVSGKDHFTDARTFLRCGMQMHEAPAPSLVDRGIFISVSLVMRTLWL